MPFLTNQNLQINLTLPLTEKQDASLTKRIADSNLSKEDYLKGHVLSLLDSWVDTDYRASAAQLTDAAKDLPQSTLDAIIASIKEAAETP